LSGCTRSFMVERFRTSLGDWMAVVHYQVYYADGRPQPRIWSWQRVPFYVLEARSDDVPLGRAR
jgi:hypothetical protein